MEINIQNMNKKIEVFKILPSVIFILLWLFIMITNMFYSKIDYIHKVKSLFPNYILIILGIIVILLMYMLLEKININDWSIRKASFLLFISQAYIVINIFFRTDSWDPSGLYWGAKLIVEGKITEYNDWLSPYFSYFPFNQFIIFIHAVILQVNKMIGIDSIENGVVVIALIQCIVSTYAGKCLFDIIQNITSLNSLSWLGWFIYVVLIGLSGWNVITYTDMIVIAIPLMILKIYVLNDHLSIIKWFLIITLSYWGFKIKATVIIVTISIVCTEILFAISHMNKKIIRKILLYLLIGACGIYIYAGMFSMLINQSGVRVDKEANTGILHMIMMGLNPINDGAWYEEDVKLSTGILGKEERTQAQKNMIITRLYNYGPVGFIQHIRNKSLIVYNDGNFAWGCEGGFYDIVYPDLNSFMSPLLKEIYYDYGSKYIYVSTFRQLIWLVVILGSAGVIMGFNNKKKLVIIIALIGIIFFNYTFEARARYVLLYVSFFIIAFMISIKNIKSLKASLKN